MIDADTDGCQTKSHGSDATGRIGSAVVLDQAVIGIGFIPEKVEGSLLNVDEESAVLFCQGLACGKIYYCQQN